MIITLVMALQMTAFMGRIAITSYYVIYCLGSFTMIALIMTIPSLGGIVGSFFVPFFCKEIRKEKCAHGIDDHTGNRTCDHVSCTI